MAPLKAETVRRTMEDSRPQSASLAVLTDEVLMLRVGEGDERAYAVLVDRHLGPCTGLAARLAGHPDDGEEIIQEAFLRLWRYAPKWQEGGAKFTTWFYRVILNLSIDHKRKTGKWAGKTMPLVRQDDDGEETTLDLADDGEAADDGLQRQEQAATVQEAVANLPERQRTAITLCYFQELSNREAAEIMEINIKALESLLSRGRRGLQQSLGQLKSEV